MKKIIAFLLLLVMLMSLVPACLADYAVNGVYMVESYKPNGYCYLYDQPSSTNGRNLGRLENGDLVWVYYYNSKGWYYVHCSKGEGYIHDYALTTYPAGGDIAFVNSTKPNGYCYMYDRPSSTNGRNMGRYENGEMIVVTDWYADSNYAKVYSPRTGNYGYIRKTCLELCWYWN